MRRQKGYTHEGLPTQSTTQVRPRGPADPGGVTITNSCVLQGTRPDKKTTTGCGRWPTRKLTSSSCASVWCSQRRMKTSGTSGTDGIHKRQVSCARRIFATQLVVARPPLPTHLHMRLTACPCPDTASWHGRRRESGDAVFYQNFVLFAFLRASS